jgi:ATP-dependent protease Clp ATPase subunit
MPRSAYDIERILAGLSSHIRGQERALTVLAVLLSMHMRWFDNARREHPSPNGLMIGPTGVGKTYTIQRAAEILRIPYVVVDTTALVPAGIVGLQIEDIAEELVESAKTLLGARRAQASARLTGARLEGEKALSPPVGEAVPSTTFVEDLRRTLSKTKSDPTMRMSQEDPDRVLKDAISLAERGIVFFDEFDKIAVPDPKERKTANTNAAQVQRRLLKFIEGASIRVGVKTHGGALANDHFLDTSGILCIASGAFADLGDSKRKRGHELARFRSHAAGDVIAQDVIEYGFMPELVARLPVLIEYSELSIEALREILADVEGGPLRVWRDYVPAEGLELQISDDAMTVIAEYAYALRLGARGLTQVVFPLLAQLTAVAKATGADVVQLRSEQLLAHPTM